MTTSIYIVSEIIQSIKNNGDIKKAYIERYISLSPRGDHT